MRPSPKNPTCPWCHFVALTTANAAHGKDAPQPAYACRETTVTRIGPVPIRSKFVEIMMVTDITIASLNAAKNERTALEKCSATLRHSFAVWMVAAFAVSLAKVVVLKA